MSRRWLFIRHGESVANAEGWLAGHVDAALTERGVAQATALADELRGEVIDVAYASDLHRAKETARLSLGERPFLQHPGLRERYLGGWERARKADLLADGRWDALLSWTDGPPNGESQRMVAIRMLGVLDELDLAHPDEATIAVFSHGTALRTVVGLLDSVPIDEIGRTLLKNTERAERIVARGEFARMRARIA